MFIIGLNMFGGHKPFDANVCKDDYQYLSLEQASYNSVRVDAEIVSVFSKFMREWEAFTLLLGNFNGSLESGNLQQNGQGIQSLRFKKRAKGSLDWLLIEELPYNKEQNIYTVHDRLAYAQEEYEYGLTPVTNEVEGGMVTDSIVCNFDGLWVVDRDKSARLFCDVGYGTIEYKRNIAVFETLERKYPMVQASNTSYRTGSNEATIVSASTLSGTHQYGLDYLRDRKEVDSLLTFLSNHKAKVLKDGGGRQYLIMAHDATESPRSGFGGGLSTVAFNWTEIGDVSSLEDLITFDLIPERLGDPHDV